MWQNELPQNCHKIATFINDVAKCGNCGKTITNIYVYILIKKKYTSIHISASCGKCGRIIFFLGLIFFENFFSNGNEGVYRK